MRMVRFLLGALLALLLAVQVAAPYQKKKGKKKKGDEEPVTQVLTLPPDPPAAVVADVTHMSFHVSPLSNKGLLSAQVRDAVRALMKQAGGAQIVKLRAFVAGTGDLRRVPMIVSEAFTEKKQSVPALSTVQVGLLPMEGAQVLIEAVALDKKAANPNGLAFFSGQQVTTDHTETAVAPLVKQSIERLQTGMKAVHAEDVLRVTCYLSSLGDVAAVRQQVSSAFPRAAVSEMQLLRGVTKGLVECEAVGRLGSAPASPLELVNPPGLTASPNYSQIALVGPGRIAFSGLQMAFHNSEEDARLAFNRLKKALEGVNADIRKTAFSSFYPLTQPIAERIRGVRFEFYDKAHPPASTLVVFEGLPSMDASFGVEVITVM